MVAVPQYTHHIYKNFDERGILSAALDAGWTLHPSENGFRVPVYDLDGTRSMWSATYNVTENAREQFGKVNLSGKPQHIRYYLLSSLHAAVTSSGGTCYLASGLTDLLSYHAAGIRNVIAPLGGESAVPGDFADDLQKLGIREIVYLPDKDSAGKRSAQKVSERLRDSEVKFRAYEIPGTAKDINELWASFTSLGPAAKPVFHAAITAAPKLILKEPNPAKLHSERLEVSQTPYQEFGVKGFKGFKNGKSNPLHCHFHDDHNPSAVLFENKETGKPVYFCSVCGTHHLEGERHTEPHSKPQSLEEALISKGETKLARLLDTLAKENLLGVQLTIRELHEKLAKYYTYGTLRNTIHEFCTKMRTSSFFVDIGYAKNVQKSRPPRIYQMPTLEQVAEKFHVPMNERSFIEHGLTSIKEYRMAVHAERIKRQSDAWKRQDDYPAAKTLADSLRISKRTLWRYEKEMPNLGRKRRFEDKNVPQNYELTPADRDRGAYLIQRRGQKLVRYPLPSERWIIEAPEPFQEPPEPDQLYCRNCGQQPMFPDDPPHVCDFCGAISPWEEEPPLVAPETLRENGSQRIEL